MKVIFLDVDGVLNSHESWHAKRANGFTWHCAEAVDPLLVGNLQQLLERAAPVSLVLSSTWRKLVDYEDGMGAILRQTLPGFTGQFIGATPSLWRDSEGKRLVRGDEIQAWLDAWHDAGREPITGICILDDDSDMRHLKPWLVQTNMAHGLRPKHVRLARKMLTRQPMPWRK